ncbi:S1C family serine protease [Weissella tructae]|uniref:HtrA protein n=2 Tax=Weissella TaxID=46255 RepID=A0A075TXS3_9LACO|nr:MULTISPECIES: trypsin-like peptidase domain-containing protein [Weissella]AIG64995.1 HtrA protein [Weissella tructae]AIM62307.1 HtrA protein [Weissella ceti]
MKKTMKTVVIALLAGLIGGGLSVGLGAYYGVFEPKTEKVVNSSDTKVADTAVKDDSKATQAFKSVSGAIVSVINLQGSQNSDELLETASEGSGVIYKSSGRDAYVVTNNHVVDGSKKIQILMQDGTKEPAELVGTDVETDLAVLKISNKAVKDVAKFANSDQLQPGETALAIGSPLGSEYATSVTEGIISAPKREIETQAPNGQRLGKTTVIQTDAAINPGNSGGALVNLAGQVVGINSMKLSTSQSGTAVEGMGFAIPANTVVKIIEALEKDGKVTRPSLGVSLYDLSNISSVDQADVLKLPTKVKTGVVVIKTTRDGSAEKAGLKKFDVITKLNDISVSDANDLRNALYKFDVNEKITVTYYRDGKEQTVQLQLQSN